MVKSLYLQCFYVFLLCQMNVSSIFLSEQLNKNAFYSKLRKSRYVDFTLYGSIAFSRCNLHNNILLNHGQGQTILPPKRFINLVQQPLSSYRTTTFRPATHTDFYQYIQIFYPSNLAKYWFSSLKFGKIQIFSGMRRGFLYIFFSHTDFSTKIHVFLVTYTDFVLDQGGRSVHCMYFGISSFRTIFLYVQKQIKK